MFKAKNVKDKSIVAMKLIKIFDMDNEKQRDSCLKEVQLHQVSSKFHFLRDFYYELFKIINLAYLII